MKNLWEIIIAIACSILFLAFTIYMFSPKHTVRFELDSSNNDRNAGIPVINVDVENSFDYKIYLSKEVTWEEAINITEKLNKQLKENPIK